MGVHPAQRSSAYQDPAWGQSTRRIDATALHRSALAENIGVAPGSIFSVDKRFAHCIRINCGHSGPTLRPALRRLGELAHQRQGKSK